MSAQQEALLEVMRQMCELHEFKRTSEIQRVLQKQTGHPISSKSICRSLKGLARSNLVELRKESGQCGPGGCCYFWRIKDSSQ
jgi:DNA-binding HxlR family transcriptional regulator